MRKITTVLVFAMVMILTGVAHAGTLTITDGDLVLVPLDTVAMFSGDGFSAVLSAAQGGGLFRAIGTGTDPISVSTAGLGGFVTVGATNYFCQSDPPPGFSTCGVFITATHLPLPPPPNNDWFNTPSGYSVFTPFSATGQFRVGVGFGVPGDVIENFVGQGIVEGLWCNPGGPNRPPENCRAPLSQFPALIYTFSVAEPPTLLLVAFGMFGAVFIARFFATAGHRTAARLQN